MKGCPVTVAKILSMLPRVKIKATAMKNARVAFTPTDHMIALGSVSDASRISSAVGYVSSQRLISLEKYREEWEKCWFHLHMWTEQSYPMSTLMGVVKPIIADSPVVGQPPLLVNSSKVVRASARGPIIQRGMMMAKKPAKWRIRTMPSMRGSCTANTVLKMIENEMAAIDRSVPCRLCHT